MVLNFKNNNFVIEGKVTRGKSNLTMKVFKDDHINTKTLPSTIPVLAEDLPSIFECQCFNDDKKNFKEESQETELGHLFEHIMLEYLCMAKIEEGKDEAVYEGVTNWNWKEEELGTFNIEITAGLDDIKNIQLAFDRSIKLLGKILS